LEVYWSPVATCFPFCVLERLSVSSWFSLQRPSSCAIRMIPAPFAGFVPTPRLFFLLPFGHLCCGARDCPETWVKTRFVGMNQNLFPPPSFPGPPSPQVCIRLLICTGVKGSARVSDRSFQYLYRQIGPEDSSCRVTPALLLIFGDCKQRSKVLG